MSLGLTVTVDSVLVTVKPLESRIVTETLKTPADDGKHGTVAPVPLQPVGK
jgi:hypothetical protein